MDVEEAEGDSEWTSFFQSALQIDPKLDCKEISQSFCYSENGIDIEVTEQEQQRYINFLSLMPETFNKIKYWPNVKQKMLVLSIAAYVSQNEQIFIKLNTSNCYKTIINMVEITKPSTSSLIKLRYLDMLCSFFEHDAGLRWSLESNHWTGIYDLVLSCQSDDCADKAHSILSKFLQRTSKLAPKVCLYVVKQMVQNVITHAHKNYPKTKKQPIEPISPDNSLLVSVICLVEILERLLASPATDILKYFIKLQVREASDTLAILSDDSTLSLQVNRIMIILSFYEMTELFDGIQVVNHDPIALSGFLRIVERELKKRHLVTIFELYYYALKYWKNVYRKMPKYFFRGKPVDIEDELMSFQVEPLVIIAEKMLGTAQTLEEELRNCHLADLLNVYSVDSLQLGYEVREHINKSSLQVEIVALKCLIRSKPMYSRKNMAIVFQSLAYALKDLIIYIKKYPDKPQFENDHILADVLLEAILVYLENFDLSWRESIGSIELTNLVYEFMFYSNRWCSNILLKGLKTLNITILKHMSPNMALLVDTTQNCSLNELGSMLFSKCFNRDPEVRNAALVVVTTICQKINKGFVSFLRVMEQIISKDLIINMAMTDQDRHVRATAVMCLQEMIVMDGVGQKLLTATFIDQILDLVKQEQEPMVLREAVTLISRIYQCEWNCESNHHKLYDIMTRVALRGSNPEVQEQAVKFWEQVTKKQLEKQGMTDDSFPTVIFSKEHKKIIRMDDTEIQKRLIQVLDSMSKAGCFGVFQAILQNEHTPKPVHAATVSIVGNLWRLLQQYEVTPELILFNQTYPNLWSLPSQIIHSPSSLDDDDSMQEIIEETVMEMINGSVSFSPRHQLGNRRNPRHFLQPNQHCGLHGLHLQKTTLSHISVALMNNYKLVSNLLILTSKKNISSFT